MPGWRRSADRARLRQNSLLTGNFTGNFPILGLQIAPLTPEATVPQRLLAQFPTRTNRENILKNREFSSENREFLCSYNEHRVSVHFSHTFPVVRRHDRFSCS